MIQVDIWYAILAGRKRHCDLGSHSLEVHSWPSPIVIDDDILLDSNNSIDDDRSSTSL